MLKNGHASFHVAKEKLSMSKFVRVYDSLQKMCMYSEVDSRFQATRITTKMAVSMLAWPDHASCVSVLTEVISVAKTNAFSTYICCICCLEYTNMFVTENLLPKSCSCTLSSCVMAISV